MKLGLIISFLFYFVTLMLMQNQRCSGCLEKERIGLLEIKHYILSQKDGGDSYNIKELGSWVDDRDSNCCVWKRVKCSSGHITELSIQELLWSNDPKMLNVSLFRSFEELRLLDLSFNSIQGWIGNEGFPKLKKLETLDLSGNKLDSRILPSLNGLTALRTLNLGQNLMINSFSVQDVQNLRNLKMLSLSDNYMEGSPEGLCKLRDLVELDISRNKFSAKLPECLSNLTNLRVLDLSYNLFSGNFPSFISNLTSLGYLSFYGNYMQGSFSLSTLANHSNLQHLYISSKKNNGVHIETEKTKWFPKFQLKSLILKNCNLDMNKGSVIPTFLSYQYNLILMDLSSNNIVGSLPSWLIHNDRIQHLDISNNNFSGLLPKDIGIFLPSVTYLNFSWNRFEGNIPSSIGKMKVLEYLDFSHNHFLGELPKQLATDCDNLQYLKVSNNFLHGNIPKFVNVVFLFLNNNNFSGTLEDVLGNNTSLAVLSISNNSISGTIPSSIGMFSSMGALLLSENLLEGEIPVEISNMSSLQMLDLSQNKLIGSIPNSIASLKHLYFLYLQKNDLSGSIPSELSEGSQLALLDLRENKLSGKIPNWMDKLSELRVLLLSGNKFEGDIPIQLCQLKEINIMDLSRNMLNASIPSCFRNMSFGMRQYVDGDYTPIFGIHIFGDLTTIFFNTSLLIQPPWNGNSLNEDLKLEVEIRTKHNEYFYKGKVLENMTGLDLSCNKLIGTIPFQIGDLQQIKVLNLSHNHLTGPIPITFSNLTQIESLDLSYNNLSGKIPYQLTKLTSLGTFNVSYNNLFGTPPSTRQFATFLENSYRGNPGLCGPLLDRKCEGVKSSPSSQSNDNEEEDTNVDMVTFYWSFTASYITILLAFITVLCINPRWRMAWFYYISKFMRRFFPSFPLY